MKAYLVRTIMDADLVGIFVVDSLERLSYEIDACCDVSDCEAALLPEGGLMWPSRATPVPMMGDSEDEPDGEDNSKTLDGCQPSPGWEGAIWGPDSSLTFAPLRVL